MKLVIEILDWVCTAGLFAIVSIRSFKSAKSNFVWGIAIGYLVITLFYGMMYQYHTKKPKMVITNRYNITQFGDTLNQSHDTTYTVSSNERYRAN